MFVKMLASGLGAGQRGKFMRTRSVVGVGQPVGSLERRLVHMYV